MKSYKDILESLKGGQRKLDKNKNGKLDASDFKALRNEEEDEVSEDMYSSDYKYNAVTGRKTKAKRIAMNFGDKEDSEKDDEKKEVKTEQHAVAPVLDRKYIKGTPEHKAYKATKKPINGHPTNMNKEEVVDEAETTVTRDKAGKIISFKHVGDWKKSTSADKKKNPVGKVANIAGKAMQSMKKMAKEDVEELDELSKGTLSNYVNKAKAVSKNAAAYGKIHPGTDDHDAADASWNKHDKLEKGIKKAASRLTKEDKDEQEYGYEGAMAITQLKTLMRHAEHMMGMMEEDTDLPEWVQSKITLATDYVQTAHDYLMSEMNEEALDERNKENALKRKTMDASRGARYKASGNKVPDAEPEHKTGQQHNKAIGRALRNEKIEHVDEVVRVRDRDRAKIDPEYGKKGPTLQHRTDRGDLADAAKDRRAKTSAAGKHGVSGFNSTIKKKDQAHRDTSSTRAYNVKEEIEEDEVKVSYRDFIKEYESKDGKYVHKGSYGSSYKDPEGEDEPSAKKTSAKKAGRPAGAKSGALQKRQPIKFK